MGFADRARFSALRRLVVGTERLEGRELPSIAYLLYAAAAQQSQPAQVHAADVQPTPTPHELAREALRHGPGPVH
jgi:hypothetical protein